jgi:hypothetical protein
MRPALLGPCFKTGPPPSLTHGGPSTLPRLGVLPASVGAAALDGLSFPTPAGRPGAWSLVALLLTEVSSVAPRAEPHEAETQRHLAYPPQQALRWPLLDPPPGRAPFWQPGPASRAPTPLGMHVISRGAYSRTASELRRRLHRVRLDDLLALLPECFAQFPHGTFVLSGSHVEI